MKLTREAKTAILVISSILLFIWGYSFLRGRDLFNSYKTFYVIYDDVEGLTTSAPVTLNGLVIGKVNSITFKDTIEGKLLVELQVKNNDFPISKTSHATLHEPGLGIMGGKEVAIVPDTKNPQAAEDGDFLQSGLEPSMLSEVGQKLSPLQNKVEATVVSADSLLHNINNVFDRQTQVNLRNAIQDLSATMNEFSNASRSLNSIIAGNKSKIDGTLTNLNRTTDNLASITDSINSANLAQTVRKLEGTLANVDNILSEVQSGKGTIGKLLKDEAVYQNLDDATKELKELLADVKNNPKRYVHFSVFGKKGTPYEEEEKK